MTTSRIMGAGVAIMLAANLLVFVWPIAEPADADSSPSAPASREAVPPVAWPQPSLFDRPAPIVAAEPVQTEAAQAPQASRPELVGIVRDGEGYSAWLRTDHNPARRFAVGDEIAGWRILRVGDTQVELELEGRREALRLFETD